MTARIAALCWVPPEVRGYVKDLGVRWALEEAGAPYEVELIDPRVPKPDSYREWQPFGQVPAYRDDAVELFESGAIVLHIAAKCETLAPSDEAGRARVTAWVIAALNSIEPWVQGLLDLEADSTVDQRARAREKLDKKLTSLSDWLGDKPYLEGRYTAGDLVMTTVLRKLVESNVLAQYANLDLYRQRCEARPAFSRALDAQMKAFRDDASL